ncbi:MAG TPA: metallophosphoesterase [Chloroflexota bacterium]|jgi:hypothetical protein|nr:metallophosphoesterase [Chloroflexota bacterium]
MNGSRAIAGPRVVDLTVPPDRAFRLGVLSDTHWYSRAAAVPESAIARMGACDAYLHCGDFLQPALLQPLRERAALFCVLGNVDPAELTEVTPARLLLRLGSWRIGAVHVAGHNRSAWRRTADRFPERLDVLCFGHSHRSVAEQSDGIVFLNPGSAVDPRGQPAPSVAVLEMSDSLRVQVLRLAPLGAPQRSPAAQN